MNSYKEVFRNILEGETLEQKLMDLNDINFDQFENYEIPALPGRQEKIKISEKRVKFPKNFESNEAKSKALHFFANHELLAIEMMAAALLYFPHDNLELLNFKKGIVKTLKDEQKHFKLYLNRMRELGIDFGDIPVNDFFWRQMQAIKTPQEYLAMMALTFEMANLDFAETYKNTFRNVGDEKSANVMQVVLEDEISHVAFGVHFLNRFRGTQKLWEYYSSILPFPLTPARSKGGIINIDARLKTGVDQEFLESATHYNDHYRVTERKNWKK